MNKTYSGPASSLYQSCLESHLPITRRYLLLCPIAITVTELNRKNETGTKLLNGGEIMRKMDDQLTEVSS